MPQATDDPVAYVLSLNLHRRNLNPGEKAMSAAKAKGIYDRQAKERQKARVGNQPGADKEKLPELSDSGQARDKAGAAFGISGKTVDYGTKVNNAGTQESCHQRHSISTTQIPTSGCSSAPA